jgi:arabinofuranan 3-O-arabinosyltransferase
VPGTEFGAFQWGYTVDQPLPALTERPLVTRDLLPLGSPAAMDLAFGLDDRIQAGTIEPDAVAAVARLLGVDTIWVTGDVSYDRFRLARPEVVTDELTSPRAIDAGLVDATAYGEPVVMASVVPMVDNRSLGDPRVGAPIPPVTLIDVDDPIPTVRVKDRVVVLAGSGDGIVDAAAAGVIDGSEAVLYQASIDPETPTTDPYRYVLTDSNRDRAHHWRSSQDVTGFTESADAEPDVLRFESGDQRLAVFDGADPEFQTVSTQEGPVEAKASSYGERFAYLPEHRPVMAIDGDPSTAWLVADRAPALGEFIELRLDDGVAADHVDLLQPPAHADERTITEVAISVNGLPPVTHALDGTSRTGSGQRIEIDPTAVPSDGANSGVVRITITETTRPQPPIGEAIGGVGFAEIDFGLGPTTEFIRTPVDVDGLMSGADGVDIVLTRLRTEPADRWRDDPEPVLRREVDLSVPLVVDTDVTLHLHQRLDDVSLAALLDEPVVASSHLTGVPAARGAAAFDGDESTAWITPFGRGVGERVTFKGTGTASELTIAQPGGDHSPITGLRIVFPGGSSDVELAPDADAIVEFPRPVDLSTITFEITDVEPRFVQNRRFNEPTQLPAAVSEFLFDGRSPAVQPVERLSVECSPDFLTVDGVPMPVSFDVPTSGALAGSPVDAEACGGSLELDVGRHTVVSQPGSSTGFDVDRVVMSTVPPTSTTSQTSPASGIDPTQPVMVESGTRNRVAEVPPCPEGCWVILGEGFNPAWRASADGDDLGAPTLLDGNANGWWLEPTTSTTRVEFDWPVQRSLTIAFALTALAVLVCLILLFRDRRRSDDVDSVAVRVRERRPTVRTLSIAAVVSVLGAALFIDWVWAIPAVLVWAVAIAIGPRWANRVVGSVGATLIIGAGLIVTNVVRSEAPFPDAGWPARFEWLHAWTLLGVVLIVGSALSTSRRESPG